MKIRDLTELATRNLRESSLRNSLTTIGIAVGVASLVSMLALGIGLQQLASKRLERTGLFDTISVWPLREGPGGFNREGRRKAFAPVPEETRPLDDSVKHDIERLPNVAEVFPDIRIPAELRYEDRPIRTTLLAVPDSARETDAFEGIQGRFFSSQSAAEVVLQKSFAAELTGNFGRRGSPNSQPDAAELAKTLNGKELSMTFPERAAAPSTAPDGTAFSVVPGKRMLKIVGVIDPDAEGFRGRGRARVFVPLQFAENLHFVQLPSMGDGTKLSDDPPAYTSLNVRVKDASQVQTVEATIKKMGFTTFSILDAARSLQRLFAVIDLFLGAFGSLALAVASIGIVNTLVMAILERRREIGIMKALGASDTDVKRIFFAEAGAMGILGGATGVALGWTIGRAINFGANIYLTRQGLPEEQLWSVPWWLVGGAIAFALVVSLLSGWYPAARASRLDPVQALRYE
jgi:putative ABC transport system permease protein